MTKRRATCRGETGVLLVAIIDRDRAPLREGVADVGVHAVAHTSTVPNSVWAMPARVFLAALSAAAGVIHLVMVPSHAGSWLPEGVAFAAAGWLQLAIAVLLLVRPSRPVLWVSCFANLAFIATLAVSRLWGLPVGPEAGLPSAASFIDIACVGFEAVLVVGGFALLARPTLGDDLSSGARVILSILPIGALAIATAAIASPSAVNHAHVGGADATHDAAGAVGHDHGGAATDGHGSATEPVDDKGLSLIMNGAGEGGGHVHDDATVPLDPATQAQLDAQLAKMQPLMERYPTVRDAEAAGFTRQGPYSPALGAHYGGGPVSTGMVNLGPGMSDEALEHPMLIFDGVSPDSELVGFMYNIFSLDTQNPPEGFAGPNDHWHYHTNVCITTRPGGGTDAPFGADQSATKALCDTVGGTLIENTGYMVHVWPVPGWESPDGLFSNLNPKLTCPDGTYYTVPMEELGTRTNACRDVPA